MSETLERAAQRIAEWRRDPVKMVVEEFGVTPDAWQVDALRAFAAPYDRDPRMQRIAMQACAGPGKSAVEAWCGWNFLVCYAEKGFHPNAAAVSITGKNLKDNLWKEMAVWQGRSPFLQAAFTWTSERIFAKDHPQTWWLSARAISQSASPEEQGRTLSGLHARYILYLIDESGDIPPSVLRAAEQGLSNCAWGKIMTAGNPTSQAGLLFHAVARQSHLWTIIRINGDPDDPKRSPRIDLNWAREQIRLHGRDNAWVMAYILGQFPPGGLNTLLSPDDVYAAIARHVPEDRYQFVHKRLGIDVARFGDDETVIFPRQGLAAFNPVGMRGATTDAIAARVMRAKDSWGSELEVIDDTGGWAGGVIDQCALAGVNLLAINASGKATNPRYYNARAENWFEMAAMIKRGMSLPDVPGFVDELCTPRYTFKDGKFLLEDKEMTKTLLGRSPDHADALALTFSLPDQPTSFRLEPALATAMTARDAARERNLNYDPFTQLEDPSYGDRS